MVSKNESHIVNISSGMVKWASRHGLCRPHITGPNQCYFTDKSGCNYAFYKQSAITKSVQKSSEKQWGIPEETDRGDNQRIYLVKISLSADHKPTIIQSPVKSVWKNVLDFCRQQVLSQREHLLAHRRAYLIGGVCLLVPLVIVLLICVFPMDKQVRVSEKTISTIATTIPASPDLQLLAAQAERASIDQDRQAEKDARIRAQELLERDRQKYLDQIAAISDELKREKDQSADGQIALLLKASGLQKDLADAVLEKDRAVVELSATNTKLAQATAAYNKAAANLESAKADAATFQANRTEFEKEIALLNDQLKKGAHDDLNVILNQTLHNRNNELEKQVADLKQQAKIAATMPSEAQKAAEEKVANLTKTIEDNKLEVVRQQARVRDGEAKLAVANDTIASLEAAAKLKDQRFAKDTDDAKRVADQKAAELMAKLEVANRDLALAKATQKPVPVLEKSSTAEVAVAVTGGDSDGYYHMIVQIPNP